jgi:hypothetical protein
MSMTVWAESSASSSPPSAEALAPMSAAGQYIGVPVGPAGAGYGPMLSAPMVILEQSASYAIPSISLRSYESERTSSPVRESCGAVSHTAACDCRRHQGTADSRRGAGGVRERADSDARADAP